MRIRTFIAVMLLPLLFQLSGCAAPTTRQVSLDPEQVRIEEQKQLQLAVKQDQTYNERLQKVSWPILRAAVPLCTQNTTKRIGIFTSTINEYGKNYRPAASEVLGLDENLRIVLITPGSPAEEADIQLGDIVASVNGKTIPPGKKAVKSFAKLVDEDIQNSSLISLKLIRGEDEIFTDVTPDEVCRFAVFYNNSDEVNAYADGNNIVITKGMLRFATDDKELALVVAHELAHNSQEHIKAKTQNYMLGAIFDIAAAAYGVNTQGAFGQAAAGAYSQEFEAEADYVGLYMLALADMEISESADFWRQMGIDNPGSITKNYASSHPSTAERSLAIEAAVEEILQKRQLSEELRPEEKEK